MVRSKPRSDPRLGQVFTPAPVADLALALALDGAPERPRLLDPACGDGVFLARALARGVPASHIHGVELDAAIARKARAAVPRARVTTGDFLDETPAAYDTVVGNPPYVRQERLGRATKERIAACVAADWPDLDEGACARFVGRADLALAFCSRALRFVDPGGRVAFVLSQAALEAGYGEALRELLPGRGHLLAIVASPRERWFPDAAVHGVIVVLERARGGPPPPARFARLRVPIAAAAHRVASLADLAGVADVRILDGNAALDTPWSPLLRAPEIWFDAAAACAAHLVPLGSIARVRRGVTSGANELFYLSAAAARRHRIEERFLVPVLKSPREARCIAVDPSTLPVRAFVCPPDTDLSAAPGARAWIQAHSHLARRPTLRQKPRWWSLSVRPARLFLTKAYDARFVQPYAAAPVVADQRVYALDPRGCDPRLVAAVLNSSLSCLALESLGRASLGEGALEWSVSDARRLPVLDPRSLENTGEILDAFRRLASRPIGAAAAEAKAPDRLALDRAVLASIPEVASRAGDLAAAWAAAVDDRLARSRVSR